MKLFRKKQKPAAVNEPPQAILGDIRTRVEESGVVIEVFDFTYECATWIAKARVSWSAVDELVASLMAARTERIKQLETELAGHLEQLRKRATP